MRSDLTQQVDVSKIAQPAIVIDHDGIGRAIAEGKQPFEDGPDARDIRRDRRVVEHLPRRVLAARVSDLGGPSAHDDDRFVARLLETAQHHDLHEAADMEAGRCRVEADIARHDPFACQRIQPVRIGDLMNIAALVERAQKFGLKTCHLYSPVPVRGSDNARAAKGVSLALCTA